MGLVHESLCEVLISVSYDWSQLLADEWWI